MTELKQPFDDVFDNTCTTRFIDPIAFLKDFLTQVHPDLTQEKINESIDHYFIYEKEFEKEYVRRSATQHDGTFIFTTELILNTFAPLFDGTSFYKPEEEKLKNHLKNNGKIKYMIGDITLKSLDGVPVTVPAGTFTGSKEYCEIPVKIIYL